MQVTLSAPILFVIAIVLIAMFIELRKIRTRYIPISTVKQDEDLQTAYQDGMIRAIKSLIQYMYDQGQTLHAILTMAEANHMEEIQEMGYFRLTDEEPKQCIFIPHNESQLIMQEESKD